MAQKLEAEAVQREAASAAMRAATEQLKEQNDANANNRYRHAIQGTNPASGARYI